MCRINGSGDPARNVQTLFILHLCLCLCHIYVFSLELCHPALIYVCDYELHVFVNNNNPGL